MVHRRSAVSRTVESSVEETDELRVHDLQLFYAFPNSLKAASSQSRWYRRREERRTRILAISYRVSLMEHSRGP